jgi:hypothetical protein
MQSLSAVSGFEYVVANVTDSDHHVAASADMNQSLSEEAKQQILQVRKSCVLIVLIDFAFVTCCLLINL